MSKPLVFWTNTLGTVLSLPVRVPRRGIGTGRTARRETASAYRPEPSGSRCRPASAQRTNILLFQYAAFSEPCPSCNNPPSSRIPADAPMPALHAALAIKPCATFRPPRTLLPKSIDVSNRQYYAPPREGSSEGGCLASCAARVHIGWRGHARQSAPAAGGAHLPDNPPPAPIV